MNIKSILEMNGYVDTDLGAGDHAMIKTFPMGMAVWVSDGNWKVDFSGTGPGNVCIYDNGDPQGEGQDVELDRLFEVIQRSEALAYSKGVAALDKESLVEQSIGAAIREVRMRLGTLHGCGREAEIGAFRRNQLRDAVGAIVEIELATSNPKCLLVPTDVGETAPPTIHLHATFDAYLQDNRNKAKAEAVRLTGDIRPALRRDQCSDGNADEEGQKIYAELLQAMHALGDALLTKPRGTYALINGLMTWVSPRADGMGSEVFQYGSWGLDLEFDSNGSFPLAYYDELGVGDEARDMTEAIKAWLQAPTFGTVEPAYVLDFVASQCDICRYTDDRARAQRPTPAYMIQRIVTEADALAFIRALHQDGRLFHFDDSPETIVESASGKPTFNSVECDLVRARVAEMREVPNFDPFEEAIRLTTDQG